uniref:tRNA-intron lyase n=1 Tax=Fervidicoccus fontis TaxID=683846 RepID=A0A7J3ZL69_9CREN
MGIRAIVPDASKASELYRNGFFGKPFGIKKPGPLEYREVLELSLVEALYLVEKGKLEVYSEDSKSPLSFEELVKHAEERIPEFKMLYEVYKDLREKGYVVRSGLKFGSDYSLYKEGPGIDHAPFLVHVFKSDAIIDPIEIVRAGRLSHSVRKKFIIAVIYPNNVARYAALEWFKP